MRIVEQTSTILKLQGKGRFTGLFGVLFGAPFFLAGLAVILFIGNLSALKCDRVAATQIACKLTSANILRQKIVPIEAGQLQGAEVQVNEDSDGDTYRVVLITKSGKIPLTDVYSSGIGTKYRENVDKINSFIGNPAQESLLIQQDDRWFAYPFGGIFMLVGGGIILGSLRWKFQTSCIFNKSTGKMYLTEQSLIESESKEWMLHHIKEAKAIAGTDSDGDKTYNTKLILKSGEEIALEIPNPASNHYKVTESINRFLGISTSP